jgi:hypothetical protein
MRIGAFRNGGTVGLRSLRGVMVSPRLECMASCPASGVASVHVADVSGGEVDR